MRSIVWLAVALVACSRHPSDPLVEIAQQCAEHGELSCPRPILSVKNLNASQAYFRDALGFKVLWEHGEPPDFGAVGRADTVLFMCAGCQGAPGSWTMIFARDVDRLYEDFRSHGAIIRMPPTDMPWGLREMQVADPDGNVMRFGTSRH
jgi:catechol 2,3-dioxygenase-like lactoylglutathione lyase family enzyme